MDLIEDKLFYVKRIFFIIGEDGATSIRLFANVGKCFVERISGLGLICNYT